MSQIDSRVAALLDHAPSKADSDEDEDALIASLEEEEDNDPVTASLRERRLEQLHAEFSRAKSMKAQSHGTYQTIRDEKAVLEITTTTKYSIVHFFKPDFDRCKIMDRHLQILAERHFDTRIIRVDVDDVPFLVTRLKIQVLPCVIAFVDGVSKDRILGFERVGRGDDNFTTRDLEIRLLLTGVLVRSKFTTDGGNGQPRRIETRYEVPMDDDDWDD